MNSEGDINPRQRNGMGKMVKSSSMAQMNLSNNIQSLVEEFHEEAQLITRVSEF
jgi:tetrahydromethanopterin S-methyltransferase subunit F